MDRRADAPARLVHAGFKGTAALAGPLLRMRYGINDETAAKGREKTIAAIDRLESEIGPSGYLVGDGFTVADLTAAALLLPARAAAGGRAPRRRAAARGARGRSAPSWRSRPGFEWVREMYRRHRGTSAEVAA